jgi:hypothetical protein
LSFPHPHPRPNQFFIKSKTRLSYTLPFSKLLVIHIVALPFKTPSTSPKIQSPPFHNQMAGANPPPRRMDAIVVSRYSPLVLPQPMNDLSIRDYLKYIPKFTGEEDITAEEHLATFYSYADNLNIENEDV